MLKLDLNLGEDDTIFDLASLLKFGGGPSPVRAEFGTAATATAPRQSAISAPTRLHNSPKRPQAPPPLGPAPPQPSPSTLSPQRPSPVRRPTTEALNSYRIDESSPTQPKETTSPVRSRVQQPTLRSSPSLPRKEAPKVDLALELELEMEAAMSPKRSMTEFQPEHAPLTLDSEEDDPERGGRTPGPYSNWDEESTTAPVVFDEYQQKRPRRRSLASLLSLKADSPLISAPQPVAAQSQADTRRPSYVDKNLPPTPPAAGAFARGISKLRGRNGSSSSQGGQTGGSPVLNQSGTFGKKSIWGTRNGSVASLGDGNQSYASSVSAQSQTAPLSKRIADKFSSKGTNGTGSSHKTNGSYDENVTEEGVLRSGPPRRASFSNLLKEASKPMLGMSLKAARKSADLLTHSSQPASVETSPVSTRRSFDLLTQRQDVPRRASTDNLLDLATAKLDTVDLNEDVRVQQHLAATNGQTPHLQVSTASTAASSTSPFPATPTSVVSSSSADLVSAETVSFPAVARLTRGNSLTRPEGIRPGAPQPMVAVPRLVRGDSLARPSAATSRNPSPGRQPLSARSGPASPTPAQEKPPISPAEWRQRARLTQPKSSLESVLAAAWVDLEDAYDAYAHAVNESRQDRGAILTANLLPFLRQEEDSPGPKMVKAGAQRQRQILFRWLSTLTRELKEKQPTHRGACLEAVAAIAESRFMSTSALADDPDDQAQYRTAIVAILDFSVEKLNDKAVYANTLVFSGRVFALAFFRIEGVAFKLLRALPAIKRQFLMRCLAEAGVDEKALPPVDWDAFPAHLHKLCLTDLKAYTDLLLPSYPKPSAPDDHLLVQDGAVTVEMTGNWLIRWTASDSDLPFAFYRAYHRQLAAHLLPQEFRHHILNEVPMLPTFIVTGPGSLFLAASLLEKSDALVHRNLRSVTSIGPNNSNFNGEDSANLSFGQKPKVLELANRRLVSTMLDIVGGPPAAPNDQGNAELAADAATRRHAFSKMLQVWIRACVKRTSMWDTRSVFILLDLIEGLIYTLSYPAPTARGPDEEVVVPKPQLSCLEMFDIPFVFSFVKIILSTADNTVAIMRTVAFIYAHFEIFTMRPADRDMLCEHIILDEILFARLYLHWNAGVRGYFIRLLVWRLARLGVVAQEAAPDAPRDPRILQLFGLLNLRLEAIRQRHDELEPLDIREDDPFVPKRSTICSTRGVKEMPWAVDELAAPSEGDESDRSYDSDEDEDDHQEFVQQVPPTKGGAAGKAQGKDVPTVSRVVSWLKGGLGNKTNKKQQQKSVEYISHPVIEGPAVLSPPPSPAKEEDNPYDGMVSSSSSDSIHQFASTARKPQDVVVELAPPPERRPRPKSGAFFSFEFEGALAPPDGAATPPSSTSPTSAQFPSSASTASLQSVASGDTAFPRSPLRRSQHGPADNRVSKRFSKRISILPPAALDLLKESGEAVPSIPAKFLVKQGYAKALHPYAIRGLRDYEDALDEWTDWVARLQEEEDDGKKHNKGFVDVVPRLSVAWPQSFEDGA